MPPITSSRQRLLMTSVALSFATNMQAGYIGQIYTVAQEVFEQFIQASYALENGGETLNQIDLKLVYSVINGALSIGRICALLAAGYLMDRIGRRFSLLICLPLAFIGIAMQFASYYTTSILIQAIGRLVSTLYFGISGIALSLFLIEIGFADSSRGILTILPLLCSSIGSTLAAVLAQAEILGTATLWPYLMIIPIPFSILCVLITVYMKESPLYLLLIRGASSRTIDDSLRFYGQEIPSEHAATKNLLKSKTWPAKSLSDVPKDAEAPAKAYYGALDPNSIVTEATSEKNLTRPDLDSIKASTQVQVAVPDTVTKVPDSTMPLLDGEGEPLIPKVSVVGPVTQQGAATLGDILRQPELRRPIAIAILLKVMIVATGGGPLLTYTADIIATYAGGSWAIGRWTTLGVNILRTVMEIVCLLLIDYWGRRFLLIRGGVITGFGLLSLCILWWVLPMAWWLGYLSVGCLALWQIGYACANVASVTLILEILPQAARAKGKTIANITDLLLGFFVSTAFLPIFHMIGGGFVFLIFTALHFTCLIIIDRYCPETKDSQIY